MQARVVHGGSQRTIVLVFERGDEVVESLTRYAKENHIRAAHFTGVGAFAEAVLGFFDWEKKDYLRIPLREQAEVLSLAGDVALKDGAPAVHAHVVVGKSDGTAHGGHLLSGTVRPTLELVLVRSPGTLSRRTDPETGLALIRLGTRHPRSRTRKSPPTPSIAGTAPGRRSRD